MIDPVRATLSVVFVVMLGGMPWTIDNEIGINDATQRVWRDERDLPMKLSPMSFFLIRSLVDGMFLASLLVGVWEWGTLLVRRKRPAWSPVVLALGSPSVLLLVIFGGQIDVPYGVRVITLVAIWFLISSPVWRWMGSAAISMVSILQLVHKFGWSVRAEVGAVAMLAMVLLLGLTARRSQRLVYTLSVYVGALGIAITFMRFNRDPLYDFVVSVTVAILLAIYIFGRTDEERRWRLDIYRAEHDALTESLTRHGLESWLSRLQPASRERGMIVTCDLDDFKWFNDTWGHDIGDLILQTFARRLRSELREKDALVRPGGDEFVVWIPEVPEAEEVAWVKRLHHAVTHLAYELPVGSIQLGVSMGWAIGPMNAQTAQEADRQLLRAKRQGKNRVVHGETVIDAPDAHAVAYGQLGWLGDAARTLWTYWPTAAVLTNADGRIVAVNPAYERLTGRTWTQLVGNKPGINSTGETDPEIYRDMWRALSEGTPWEGNFKNSRPDGATWWASECIVPIRIGTRLVGYWSDVIEQMDASSSLEGSPMSSQSVRVFQDILKDVVLDVMFQPIVDLRQESALGYEALIRASRLGAPLSLEQFFEEARRVDSEMEVDMACLEAVRRTVGGLGWSPGQRLFVHVCRSTLKEYAGFQSYIESLAAVVPEGEIVAEISGKSVPDLGSWGFLDDLRSHVVFAQDDLGSGEADLACLVWLQPAWVKIDVSLVSRVAEDWRTRLLVEALVAFTHRTGGRVIGEGVESAAQAYALRECGVDAGQGNLWSQPLPDLRPVIPRLMM